jgi:trafficking protein particle complex subunit 11
MPNHFVSYPYLSYGEELIGAELNPQTSVPLPILLDIRKRALEDRTPTALSVSLVLRWRRVSSPSSTSHLLSSAEANSTTLPVPRLPLPPLEPRILASLLPALPSFESLLPENKIISIRYTIENPTSYFLTFNVLMEANEQFAFSGPKTVVVQVLPGSRISVDYRLFIYPNDAREGVRFEESIQDGKKGRWIRPGLRVVDRFFNKMLRVSPGGEGVFLGKGGVGVWVPDE